MDRERGSEALEPSLARWVSASLITSEQAEAIRAFEDRARKPGRRVPLIAEALGYLGAALAVGAGSVLLLETWDSLATAGRLAILGSAALLLLAGGWLVRGSDEPAVQRMGSVLWLLSAGAVAWFLRELVGEALRVRADDRGIWIALGASAYSGGLYLARRRALQQAAFALALALLVGTVAERFGPSEPPGAPRAVSLAVWGLGALWLVLAWRGALEPARTGFALGSLGALLGPALESFDGPVAVQLLGLSTAAALVAASVVLRQTLLLGFGAVGLFVYSIWVIWELFGDTLGAPLVMLAAGVVLLGVALLAARVRRAVGPETISEGRRG